MSDSLCVVQELAEKLAEPLQQRISTKFFTGAMALNASEPVTEKPGGASAAVQGPAHTELAQQLAEARQAAAASVQVCLRMPDAPAVQGLPQHEQERSCTCLSVALSAMHPAFCHLVMLFTLLPDECESHSSRFFLVLPSVLPGIYANTSVVVDGICHTLHQ